MTAVVTGAASGLGLAIATRFLQLGLGAALLDRDAERLAAAEIGLRGSNTGGRARYYPLDVADADAVADVFSRVRSELGPIAILVNAAGVADLRPASQMPLDVFTRTFAVNVTGTFLCCLEAARDMQSGGGGSIVNIASVSGLRASLGRVAYGSSKAAVISLTTHLAVEWAPDRITVNAIAPGPIETPMAAAVHNAAARQAYIDRVPAGRYGQPDEIVAATEFLVSERARYVTGQTLVVDGGYAVAGLIDQRMLQSNRPLRTVL